MTAWLVVMAHAGRRAPTTGHDLLPASLLNGHCGPVCYAFELLPAARLDLKHLTEQFEIALADGLLPPNEIRGFKWTVDIASTLPSICRGGAGGPV